MSIDFEFKNAYDVNDLVKIMHILRQPDGCPWDRVQTHESIRKNFIEETYEAIEAIDNQDSTLLCEELGDVLMQIVFHAEMEAEQGTFDFNDVTDGVCKKLIERHPHIFGDVVADTPEEVLKNWDAIKSKTKNRKTATEKMLSIPRQLPALMRAQKVQEKAAKVGFDWDDASGAMEKVDEESKELREAVNKSDAENTVEELGDLLFSVVNTARLLHIDAEEALTAATDKFQNRFSVVEALAKERGIKMEETPLAELDKLWDEAKKQY